VGEQSQVDDRAIVLEAIELMLRLAIITPDIRRQLIELRRLVETRRSDGEHRGLFASGSVSLRPPEG
jgi:hypothetical protein